LLEVSAAQAMMDPVGTLPSTEKLESCREVDTLLLAKEHFTDLRYAVGPLLVTSLIMGGMGLVCWIYQLRICPATDMAHTNGVLCDHDTHFLDMAQTQETVFINMYVAVILAVIWCSDTSVEKGQKSTPYVQRLLPDEPPDQKLLPLPERLTQFGVIGNSFFTAASVTSLLMPLQGILVLQDDQWRTIPVSKGDHLPALLNLVFAVGVVANTLSLIWLFGRSMSRPLRVTWTERHEIIHRIKNAKSHENWESLAADLADEDSKLSKTWELGKGGLVWLTVICGSLLLAMFGLSSLIAKSYTYGARVLVHDPLSALYFLLGTMVSVMLGLLLASAAFVRPFRFPDWHGHSAGIGDDCILTAVVFQHVDNVAPNTDARVERMRFFNCVQLLPLGAKLCGLPITKELVMRLYLQLGIAMPTFLSLLNQIMGRRALTTTTGPPTNTVS